MRHTRCAPSLTLILEKTYLNLHVFYKTFILQGNTLPIFVVVSYCQMGYRLVIYSGEPHIRIILIKNIQLLNKKSLLSAVLIISIGQPNPKLIIEKY